MAEVILNRADSPRYPNTVCGVVEQGGGGSCQFSFVCDGAKNTMADPEAAETAGRIARVMLDGAPRGLIGAGPPISTTAPSGPPWANRFPRTASIGSCIYFIANPDRLLGRGLALEVGFGRSRARLALWCWQTGLPFGGEMTSDIGLAFAHPEERSIASAGADPRGSDFRCAITLSMLISARFRKSGAIPSA